MPTFKEEFEQYIQNYPTTEVDLNKFHDYLIERTSTITKFKSSLHEEKFYQVLLDILKESVILQHLARSYDRLEFLITWYR